MKRINFESFVKILNFLSFLFSALFEFFKNSGGSSHEG